MRKLALISLFAFLFAAALGAQTAEKWFQKGMETTDPQQKIGFFTRAIQVNKKPRWVHLAEAYFYRGAAKFDLGRFDETIIDFDKAIQFNPELAIAYFARGCAKYKLGRYEEAVADFDKAIRFNPDWAEAYYLRGEINFGYLGRSTEALDDFDKAIQLNLTGDYEVAAFNNRGYLRLNAGRYEEAIADFDKAIQLDPNNAYAYNNRGNAKNHLGRYAEALADFDKSLELKTDQPHLVYNNRGYAHFKLGHHAEAVADWEAMQRAAPAGYAPEWNYIDEARRELRK